MNLGILAHVDAGKTSLTERLLFVSGATESLGSVDSGTTRTDSMSLEQQRGITIRSAVTAISLDGRDVNIIDTPGHSDFIAEVERSLGVLDCAVLVLSAVEGVQPQTVILWRALRRVGVPTTLFINKVDRDGADPERVVEQIRERLTPHAVALSTCSEPGTPQVRVMRRSMREPDVIEAVVQQDSLLLDRWSRGQVITEAEIIAAMRRETAAGELFPTLFGSAVTGTGVEGLQWVLIDVLPPSLAEEGEPSGTVFSVDHSDGAKRTWLRMWSGSLRVRDRVVLGEGKPARLTQLLVPTPQGEQELNEVRAGDIAAIRGPSARIGDSFGTPPPRRVPKLSPPTLQTIVRPQDPTQRGLLFSGLTDLADEDPLIGLDLDERNGNATVRIHGDVQKEVIAALLHERYGVAAEFEDTTVVCIETVSGVGRALEELGRADNPYLATIGLEIESAPDVSGVEFSPGIERGNLPAAFVAACEEGVRAAMGQGLHGWAVTGCRVTMTASGYYPRQSHAHQKFNKAMSSVAGDFRNLAPVVAMACLEQARTRVCEPIEKFDLEVPSRTLSNAMGLVGRMGAVLTGTTEVGQYHRVEGYLPSARLRELLQVLPNMTEGEGVFTSTMDHYEPVAGAAVPTRARVGIDPRDRHAWFTDMPR